MMTKTEAKNRTCPMSISRDTSRNSSCLGDACMAWRWQRPPVLTSHEQIRPSSHDGPDMSCDADQFFGWAGCPVASLGNPPPPEAFPQPPGAGWECIQVEAHDDDCIWVATFARHEDTNATGYCGMAGQPKQSGGAS